MEIAMLTAATRGLNSSIYPGDDCCAFYKETDFYNKDDSTRFVKCRDYSTHWFDLHDYLEKETRRKETCLLNACNTLGLFPEDEIDILPLSSFICGKNI